MRTALSIACIVALGSLDLTAENRPDFSGTWNMDFTQSEAAAQGTPIGPVTVTIRQTPGELHIETTREGRTDVVRYLPATAKAVSGTELIGAFHWDGPKLVTRLVSDINK